ncbi:MAG: glutamyl-tRNA synthetase, glutamyl-tRNA synthetase [candidate division WS6 bacterium GW2011_GWC1_33_20]|uniref:Glutamate--tRNA ligase n=2 Tax=Candidatus Dojkabacteria TaxID=74243 RepID=A0A0G0DGV0_9BACT|nr:MAG: glutamyl-tRNA synthetase, glutamyl-tRNA synthetase [candidate division WS6 bacterium GW2011_GWE2_33_157]KKP44088.1 MAG: glutamyl-tRNA synthetase, glutamyl-tRNA synthetase [candidate division WS6 bacterium GW2011_GWC1_33_20]KKP45040.1 MAG: glutamyl-tRNA synthetase, glutamyl-tRNA synthetase [candidate division WS6 bacterium GW2011_GWF1_33_233]KKP54207.1 MAG: glutamyl-tRNA synthetase, glutamyl-tRNA synthetase [candidate division WS6 bacterium GW2011_WS6_33_547]KKP54577.1 MAG: glutamyl-tRNA
MRTIEENKYLSELLFSDIKESPQDILKKYPERNLKEGELVLRFAPSPTGFIHIGNVYTSLVGYLLTKRSNGKFILRIEDTDKVREVENGISQIINGLEYFGIHFDEGMINDKESKGDYGPYIQSERMNIYKVFAKDLVSKGLAYPCFCTEDELESIRKEQTDLGTRTGYWGKWAKWREATFDEVKRALDSNWTFVIRLYSNGNIDNKINSKDLIKGGITLSENDMDSVLLKSDGLPTYHFAHPIDDTLMRISFVLRGDEWLSSQPLHMEIFKALGFKQLEYGHISPLMKMDGDSKRKLSKRKDPEAAVSYYIEKGYPVQGVKEYILNVANSNFYDWRIQNPDEDILEFNIRLEKFNKAGALFDISKLNDICKEYISKLKAQEIYDMALEWASKFNEDIHSKLINQKDYCISIFNIEREGSKVRKDIVKWSDIPSQVEIFFDDMFMDMDKESVDMDKGLQKNILNDFSDTYYPGDSVQEWFNKVKDVAIKNGFSVDSKEYESNPKKFKGKVGDVAMILRLAVTGKKQTPDLYQVMQVMGEERVRERIKGYINTVLV